MTHIAGHDRSQTLLLPESLDDYVGPENPVRFTEAFVDGLNLTTAGFIRVDPKRTGRPGYDPADLLKLYIYGYLNRVRSSRRLEAETHRNIEVIWLLRHLKPDFKTIADVRRDNRKAFRPVFRQFVLLCKQLDLFGRELLPAHCGCTTVYLARRPSGAARWRCKACRKDFSVTSGTLFAFHKMPLRSYLMSIAIFANEVKGKSMLALSRDLGTQYKTSFVLAHKIREAMASEVRQAPVGGEGKKAEIDGAFFGGHVRSANRRENRRDRRLRENQSGKRKVVVVIRERGGNTLPGVFRNEAEALNFIRRHVPQGTTLSRIP